MPKNFIRIILLATAIAVIFLFAALPLLVQAQSGDINYAVQSGATASCSVTSGNTVGSCSNTKDDNTGTYFGAGDVRVWQRYPPPCRIANYEVAINFPQFIPSINKVEIMWRGNGVSSRPSYANIDLYYNENWNQVAQFSDSRDWTASPMTSSQVGNWNKVSAIRIRALGSRNVGREPDWPMWYCISQHFTYELRAFGPAAPTCNDIGLRAFDGNSIIRIDTETGTVTSPLRIAKNGVVYGIKLVEPNDPTASHFKIMTASGMKSLKACA